ncbi:2566_t:CDS:2, partial [Dentiscutata erythropus]
FEDNDHVIIDTSRTRNGFHFLVLYTHNEDLNDNDPCHQDNDHVMTILVTNGNFLFRCIITRFFTVSFTPLPPLEVIEMGLFFIKTR